MSEEIAKAYKKGLQDFYEAIDARYKDFEITKAMGEILQELVRKNDEV